MPRPKRHMTSIAIHLFDSDLDYFAELSEETGLTRADVIRGLITAAKASPEAMCEFYKLATPEEVEAEAV